MAGAHPATCSKGMKVLSWEGGGKQLVTQLHLALKLKWVKLYHWSPICLHDMDRNNCTFLTFLSSMYIYRVMFYSVDFAHILYFCNASCRSVENMVVMMTMMMIITMMSSRSICGYLITVTIESVHKTPDMLLYSSVSAHCHTVNSLFRLPHSMLKALHRNLPACHFIGKVEQ